MKRYNLHLKISQLEKLEKLSEEKEEPVSRIIRNAIDDYLNEEMN